MEILKGKYNVEVDILQYGEIPMINVVLVLSKKIQVENQQIFIMKERKSNLNKII